MMNIKIASELLKVARLLLSYRVRSGFYFDKQNRLVVYWEAAFPGTFFDDLVAVGKAVQKEAVKEVKDVSRGLMGAGLISKPLVLDLSGMELTEDQSGIIKHVRVKAPSQERFTDEERDEVAGQMYSFRG